MVQKTSPHDVLDLKNQAECSLNVLLEMRKNAQKKRLLIDNGDYIFLQVVIFKIPELDEFVKRRILLKNPVWSGVPEVCLIVRDYMAKDRVKRTSDEMIDLTIEKYEELLEKHKVNGVTNVMPYQQLKTEYDTYELRRKLTSRFDTFLCDSYLHSRGNFFNCLGKIFMEKNKYPIAVKLPKLKDDYDPLADKRIASAIASTVFYIKPGSDNYSIRVGNTLCEKESILENLNVVLDEIFNSDDLIPGGFNNIRSVHIKTEKSKAVPIYMSLSTGNDIPIPVVKLNVPFVESVEDEISTLPGKKVTVLPSGEIFVTDIKKPKNASRGKDKQGKDDSEDEEEEDEEEEEDDDEEEEEEKEVKVKVKQEEKKEQEATKSKKRGDKTKTTKKKAEKVKAKKEQPMKKKKFAKNKDDDDECDMEDAIESAEQKYLANLDDEMESSEDEKKTIKKKGTKRKLKDDSKPVKKVKKEKVVQTKLKRKNLKKKNVMKAKKVK